jgi:hypothetical protein
MLCGTLEHALSDGKYVLIKNGEAERFGPDIRQATVNSLLVSDSILIWTDDCRPESLANLVIAVRSLMAFSVVAGILLRGAISLGPLTVMLNQWPSQTHSFQHSLFGKSIVDAVESERGQEWTGCMVTSPAIEFYKSTCSGGDVLLDNNVLVPYAVPLAGDMEVVTYVIDWVNHPQVRIDNQTVVGAFNPHRRPSSIEFERIKTKLTNTLKFVKHVKPSADQPRLMGQFAS